MKQVKYQAAKDAPATRQCAGSREGYLRCDSPIAPLFSYSPVYPAFTGSVLPSSWRR